MKAHRILLITLALVFTAVISCAQSKDESAKPPKEKSESRHGWLGVTIQDVTARVAREHDLSVKTGALVTDVADDSPADKAGLREDDVVTAINGKAVEEADDLTEAVRDAEPGTSATIDIMRGKEKKSLAVTLGKAPRRDYSWFGHIPHAPRMTHIPPMPKVRVFSSFGMFGLSLTDLNTQLGEYFGAPNGRGVLVEEVEKKSVAEKAGFKAGDVITKVGNETVESTRDIEDALDGVKEDGKAEFQVLRKGTPMTFTVQGDDIKDETSYRFRSGHDGGMFFNFNGEKFRNEMKALEHGLRNLGERIREQMERMRESIRREVRNVAS